MEVAYSSSEKPIGWGSTLRGLIGYAPVTAAIHEARPFAEPEDLKNTIVVDKDKIKAITAIGFAVGAVALLVSALFCMAIFCPPLLAAIGGAIGIAAIGCTSTMGVFGILGLSLPALIAGAAASGFLGAGLTALGSMGANVLEQGKEEKFKLK